MNLPSLSLRWPRRIGVSFSIAALREFFAYHGVWAVGVRLLRRWSVRTKLLVVLGLITAPIAPLAGLLLAEQAELVRTSLHRLQAVEVSARAFALAERLADQQFDIERGQSVQIDGPTQAHAQLEGAIRAAIDSGLPLQLSWERLHGTIRASASDDAIAPATRAARIEPALAALEDLQLAVVSASGMAHAGQEPIQARGDLALQTLPAMLADLSRLYEAVQRGASDATRPGADRPQAWLAMGGQLTALARERQQAGRLMARAWADAGTEMASPLPRTAAFLQLAQARLRATEAGSDEAALRKAFVSARDELRGARAHTVDALREALQARLAQARHMRLWVYGGMAFSVGLALYLLYSFFLVMNGGLRAIVQQTERMAQGNLSGRPVGRGGDEVAATMRSLNTSLVGLSDLLASIARGIHAMSQEARQVAGGNVEITERNRTAVAALHQAMEGVARQSEQLLAAGRQVEVVVNSVQALRLDAANNRRQMLRLLERMGELRGKSREIAQVASLIDGIAFRTNVLALNASVEASKAGEAGRGFAVVAQEVRSLALRGAESARRVGEIVARSTEDIEASHLLADVTGRALAATDEHVHRIHLAIGEVAELTRSGERASNEVLENIRSLEGNAEHDLELMQQLANASGALRSQGQQLAARVGQFQLS